MDHDLIAWLRTEPLDLRTLEATIAAALRAEQLAPELRAPPGAARPDGVEAGCSTPRTTWTRS